VFTLLEQPMAIVEQFYVTPQTFLTARFDQYGFGAGDAIYWDNKGDNAMDAAGYGQNVTAAKANTLSLWEAASGQEVTFDPLDESPVVQHTSSGPGDGSVKIILGGADYPAAGVLLNYTEYENTFLVG